MKMSFHFENDIIGVTQLNSEGIMLDLGYVTDWIDIHTTNEHCVQIILTLDPDHLGRGSAWLMLASASVQRTLIRSLRYECTSEYVVLLHLLKEL